MCSCNNSCSGKSASDLGANDYSLQIANIGIAPISEANSSLTGTPPPTLVFTATGGFNGSIIKSIRIKAAGPVTTGMLRLFTYNGTN